MIRYLRTLEEALGGLVFGLVIYVVPRGLTRVDNDFYSGDKSIKCANLFLTKDHYNPNPTNWLAKTQLNRIYPGSKVPARLKSYCDIALSPN